MSVEIYETATTRYMARLERELEEERREAGQLRARVEELEAALRGLLQWDLSWPGTGAEPGHAIWRAREALGLDGATGHRAEVTP